MDRREIPENLELAQTLLGQWIRYRDFYFKGISDEQITPEEETEFLETASAIAQNVRKLGQRLDEKMLPFRKTEISAQLKGAISIAHFRNLPEKDRDDFYRQLHVSTIYLSRTVGALKFMNEGYVPKVQAEGKGGKGKGKKSSSSRGGGKVVMIIVGLLAFLGGLAAALYFLGFI